MRVAFDMISSEMTRDIWRELMLTIFETGMPFFHRDIAEIVHANRTILSANAAEHEKPDEIQVIFSSIRLVANLPKTPLTAAIGIITAMTSTGSVPSDVCTAVVPDDLKDRFPPVNDELVRMLATCFVQNIYDCCAKEYSVLRELMAVQCAMQLVMRGWGEFLWRNLIIETLVSSSPGLLEYLRTFINWMDIYLNITAKAVPGTTDVKGWNRSRNMIITAIAIMVRRFGSAFQPEVHALVPPQDLTPDEITALGSTTLADMSFPMRYMISHRKAVYIQEMVAHARGANKMSSRMAPEIFETRRTELEVIFEMFPDTNVAAFLMERFLPTPSNALYSDQHPTADGFDEIMSTLDRICRGRMALAEYTLSIQNWSRQRIKPTSIVPQANGTSYATMLGLATNALEVPIHASAPSSSMDLRKSDMDLELPNNLPSWCKAYPFVDWEHQEDVYEDLKPLVPNGAEGAAVVQLHLEGFRKAMIYDKSLADFPPFFPSTQKFLAFRMTSAAEANALVRSFTFRHIFMRMIDEHGQFIRCMIPIAVRSLILVSIYPEATIPVGILAHDVPKFSPVPFALLCVLCRACNWTIPVCSLRWTGDQAICVVPPYASNQPTDGRAAVWSEADIPLLIKVIEAVGHALVRIVQNGRVQESALLSDTRIFLEWASKLENKNAIVDELNRVIE